MRSWESLACLQLCSGSPVGQWWKPCSCNLAAQWRRTCLQYAPRCSAGVCWVLCHLRQHFCRALRRAYSYPAHPPRLCWLNAKRSNVTDVYVTAQLVLNTCYTQSFHTRIYGNRHVRISSAEYIPHTASAQLTNLIQAAIACCLRCGTRVLSTCQIKSRKQTFEHQYAKICWTWCEIKRSLVSRLGVHF